MALAEWHTHNSARLTEPNTMPHSGAGEGKIGMKLTFRALGALIGVLLLGVVIATSALARSDLNHPIPGWGTYSAYDNAGKGWLYQANWNSDQRDVTKFLFNGWQKADTYLGLSGTAQANINVTSDFYWHSRAALSDPIAIDMWCVVKDGTEQATGGTVKHVGQDHVKVDANGRGVLVDTWLNPTSDLLNINLDNISGIGAQAAIQCFTKIWVYDGTNAPDSVQTYSYHVFMPKLLKSGGHWQVVGADSLPGTYGSPSTQTHVTEWFNDEADIDWPSPVNNPW